MNVYLDTCSLQRPLDDQTQMRIRLEAEAVLGIIALVENGGLELVSSEVLLFETRRNVDTTRREFAMEVLAKANHKELNAKGIMALDALHLAAAEAGQADYFCTCDDKLLKKAKRLCSPTIKAVSPIELLEEIEQ
ncbi:MAG: nucleic acid-binding protein [Acidobacteria bacterium]|nr:nucleic acid-binding protein [Acidobacteriota bacterium]